MKKLIFTTLINFLLILSVFATQLPTDFLATQSNAQTEEVEEEIEVKDPFSFTFGGNLTTNSMLTIYEDKSSFFENSENLSIWLKFPLNKTYTSFFACEGFYDFSLKAAEGQEVVIGNTLDIPLFKFTFNFGSEKTKSTLNLGRFGITDTTGFVLNQTIDGIFARFISEKTDFSLFAGYTGLLNALNSNFFDCPYIAEGNLYALSPSYFISSVSAKFNVFNTQFINTEFVASVDFNKLDYHKMYATLSLNGAISQKLYYILQSTLGMSLKSDGTEDLRIANLSKIDITSYFNFLSSSLTLHGVYASAASESLDAFKPITEIQSTFSGKYYSSLLKAGLLYTFKPAAPLFVSLSSDGVCSFNSDSTLIFDGIQWALESKWQIVSDIYLSVAGQQFISFLEEKQNQFVVGLKLGFSF